jgi:hypothetical protein
MIPRHHHIRPILLDRAQPSLKLVPRRSGNHQLKLIPTRH